MIKENAKVEFSAYTFLNLYCAIIIRQGKESIINNHDLEKKLFNYYDDLKLECLFEDICKREDSIDLKESYLDLSEAFQLAYALGVLVELKDSLSLKSIININENEAIKIIHEVNIIYVEKMCDLIFQMNCSEVKKEECEELSNFQKELNNLNAPYKKTEAYEIFGNNKRKNNISTFWDAEAGFVDKYKDVNMNRSEVGPVKKKTMEGNQNGNN